MQRWLSVLRLHLLPNQYPALHGLRVLGIVSVVQFHLTMIMGREHLLRVRAPLAWLSLRVWFGMDLFFVMSGFLIGSILMPEGRTPRPALGRFYLRRAFRTMPAYWLVLTLLALFGAVSAAQLRALPFEYLYLRTYVGPSDVDPVMPWGWSLIVEEHFYLLVPFIAMGLSRVQRPAARSALLVAGIVSAAVVRAVSREVFPSAHDVHRLYFSTHTRYDTLLTGILLAQVMRDHGPAVRALWARPGARAVAWAFVVACMLALVWPHPREGLFDVVFAWGTVTSCMYFVLLSMVVAADTWLGRLLSARVWIVIATLGYGIYLVHVPILFGIVQGLAPWLSQHPEWPRPLVWSALLTLALALTSAAAYVLHLVVEKPSLALRDRVAP